MFNFWYQPAVETKVNVQSRNLKQNNHTLMFFLNWFKSLSWLPVILYSVPCILYGFVLPALFEQIEGSLYIFVFDKQCKECWVSLDDIWSSFDNKIIANSKANVNKMTWRSWWLMVISSFILQSRKNVNICLDEGPHTFLEETWDLRICVWIFQNLFQL